ncbi:MAG TPA: HEAT repeat domain-containing protein [Oligoflexia bacterium]|nr:HEAT repeat domain-containing protein [Oligoflexia bacterium]HMP26553.1 HEAT repeat domain-containing protein [Oligoflexia bacterium]
MNRTYYDGKYADLYPKQVGILPDRVEISSEDGAHLVFEQDVFETSDELIPSEKLSSLQIRNTVLFILLLSLPVVFLLIAILSGIFSGDQTTNFEKYAVTSVGLAERAQKKLSAGRALPELANGELLALAAAGEVSDLMFLDLLEELKSRDAIELSRSLVLAFQRSSEGVKLKALAIVAELGDRRFVPAVTLLLDSSSMMVRKQAARTLGSLKDKRALGYLQEAYSRADNKSLKDEIDRAFEQISGKKIS